MQEADESERTASVAVNSSIASPWIGQAVPTSRSSWPVAGAGSCTSRPSSQAVGDSRRSFRRRPGQGATIRRGSDLQLGKRPYRRRQALAHEALNRDGALRGLWRRLQERSLLHGRMETTSEQNRGVVASAARSELADLIRRCRAILASSARAMVKLRRTMEEHRVELEAARASRRLRQRLSRSAAR